MSTGKGIRNRGDKALTDRIALESVSRMYQAISPITLSAVSRVGQLWYTLQRMANNDSRPSFACPAHPAR